MYHIKCYSILNSLGKAGREGVSFNFTLHSIQGRITFTEDANSIVRKLKTNERLPNPVGRDARTSRPFTHDFLKPKASSTESES